jgi:hypothetical protein
MTVVTARQRATAFNGIPVRKIKELAVMKRQPCRLRKKA